MLQKLFSQRCCSITFTQFIRCPFETKVWIVSVIFLMRFPCCSRIHCANSYCQHDVYFIGREYTIAVLLCRIEIVQFRNQIDTIENSNCLHLPQNIYTCINLVFFLRSFFFLSFFMSIKLIAYIFWYWFSSMLKQKFGGTNSSVGVCIKSNSVHVHTEIVCISNWKCEHWTVKLAWDMWVGCGHQRRRRRCRCRQWWWTTPVWWWTISSTRWQTNWFGVQPWMDSSKGNKKKTEFHIFFKIFFYLLRDIRYTQTRQPL